MSQPPAARPVVSLFAFLAVLALGMGAALYFAPDATPHRKSAAEIAREQCQPIALESGSFVFCGSATLDTSGIDDVRHHPLPNTRRSLSTHPVPEPLRFSRGGLAVPHTVGRGAVTK